MNNRRKIISMLLVIVMIVSVFTIVPTTASAAEADPAFTALTDENAPGFDYELNENDTALITGYSGEGGDVEIPSVIDGYEVWDVGYQAFADSTAITSVTFPETLKSIGEGAFSGCTALEEVTIPCVSEIGKDAFAGCTNLIYVTILDSPESIDPSAFPDNGLTFYGYSGTSVETYADDYGFSFISMGDATPDESVPSISTSDEVDPETCPEIKLGETRTVNIKQGGEYVFLKFVAEKNATIVFTSKAAEDTYGYLYNDKMSLLTSDDDSNGNYNFKITYNVYTGRTYFFGARFYSYYQTGLFNVTLSEQQLWEHDGGTLTGYNGTSAIIEIPSQLDGVAITSIGREAFSGCTGLTSIDIPDSVSSIGYEAFYGCTGLTSVDLPASLTSIDEYVFAECTGLTSVDFPASLMSIGYRAFSGCTGLTSVDLPASLTSIDEYVFAECTGLTSVDFPASLMSIGYRAFSGCIGLTSVDLPASLMSIGYHAFSGCTGLTSVDLPDSVTSIGDGAFRGCTGLTSVDLPASLMSIGYHAFSGCTGLTSVDLPASLASIGNYAFADCTNLESVTIPDSITSIGYGVFDNTAWENNRPDGIVYAGKVAYQLKGTCPAAVTIKDGTTAIGDSLFFGCSGLTNVTIPDSVTQIGADAFAGCSGLTSLTLPDSVTSIGSEAFAGCSGLTEFTIPGSVTEIKGNTFISCTNLKKVDIPDSIERINWGAFSHCTSLTNVYIPASVSYVHILAFSDCSGLTGITVDPDNPQYDSRNNCNAIIETESDTLLLGCQNTVIPDTVTSIGSYAFNGCTGLTSIDIPDSVTSIGYEAFSSCTGLTSLAIPGSVTAISTYAFRGCSGLTSITVDPDNPQYDSRNNCNAIIETESDTLLLGCRNTVIPDTVTSIGSYAFNGCTGLTSIDIPDSVTSIGYEAFSGCTGLTSVDIPDTVSSIGYEAFSGCTGLTGVDLPASLTSIGGGAFRGCTGLTSIDIPDTVSSIGYEAFYNCPSLTSVTIPASVTYIGESAFGYYYQEIDDGYDQAKKVDGFTICGEIGSEAERYANENDFIFNPAISTPDEAITEIRLNETVTFGDNENWTSGVGYLKFTPEEDMKVTFFSSRAGEARGYLFNENKELLTYQDGQDNDYHEPFFIIHYEVKAGKTYYLAAAYLAYDFDVTLKEYTDWEYYLYEDDTIEITRYYGEGGSVIIPASIDGYPVRSIDRDAFRICDGLTSVTIPNSVRYIENYSFYGYPSLTSVTIPDSVTWIGEEAFGYYWNGEEKTKVDGFTIYGSHGSAAEGYAYQNGFDFVATASIPADAFIEVKLNETATVYAEEASGSAYFKFTPVQDIEFVAYSTVGGSTKGYLYDSDMNLLVYNDGLDYGDDCEPNYRIRYAAAAGETYYFVVNYDSWGSGYIKAITITEYQEWDYDVLEDGTAEIRRYKGDDSEVVIPATIDGYTVTGISDYAFYYAYHDQKSVTIPASVTRIGNRAVGYCCADWYHNYDFTIYGYANTIAETYAYDNNFNFVSLGALSVLGDVTGDGQVNVLDATEVQYYLASLHTQADALRLMFADVDRNGLLEIIDVTYILRYVAGIEIPYDIGSEINNNTAGSLDDEWFWPTPDNYNITSAFGEERSVMTHEAIDIGASTGDPVFAANAGTVVSTNNDCTHAGAMCSCGGGYGNFVWILHDNGYETIYAHLVSTNVAVGSTVQKGQLIGYVGSTGQATGPHLHFELRVGGVKTDPLTLY